MLASAVLERVVEAPLAGKRRSAGSEAENVTVAAGSEALADGAQDLCLNLESEE